MKNEELDRLFRQKLEQIEGQPSPRAWQQLEQQLQHKKERKTWFYLSSIAAGILLLMGIWGSLEYGSSFIPSAPVAQEQAQEPVEKRENEQIPAVETAPKARTTEEPITIAGYEPAEKESQNDAKTIENKENTAPLAKTNQTGKAVKKPAQKNTPAVAQSVELPQAEAKTALINSLAEASELELPKPAAITEPVIIRYKADDDEDEIIETPVELAERESKELTPRKVLGFLKKVKETSSGSLAELREAKDDLLSLRLSRSDYQRAD